MGIKKSDVNGERTADVTVAVEAALLLAIAACPTLLVPFGDSPFESHKAAFLWVAAAIGLTAGLMAARTWTPLASKHFWMRCFLVTATLAAVALMISIWLSPAPALAWWGSGLRRFGGSTELALGAVLVAGAVAISADPARADRFVTALVLSSIGPTVYAIAQTAGVDPLALAPSIGARPTSTFGNPLFLAGYLAAIVPITIAYAASLTTWRKWIAWALVVAQCALMAATRSRGPLLALAAVAPLMGSLVLAVRGYRRVATGAALAIVVSSVVLVFGGISWISAGTATASPQGEDRKQATIGIRTLLWQAAGAGIRADVPARPFGSGPESTLRVLTQRSGSLLRLLEGDNVAPDRSHNETLDTAITFGLIGVAARLAIMCTLLGAAFAALGLLPRTEHLRFAALALIVSVVMAGAAWRVNGPWTLALSIPGSVVIVAALWIAWSSRFAVDVPPALAIPIAAATACWLTHYLEIQTGVTSIGSALVAVTAGAIVVTRGLPADAKSHKNNDGFAVAVGWATATLLIGVSGAGAIGAPGAIIALLVWAIANALAGGGMRAPIISAAVWLMVVLAWTASGPPARDAVEQGLALARRIDVLYFAAAVCFALLVWRLAPTTRGWSVAWIGVAAVAVIVGRTAIAVSAADVLIGAARACEAQHDLHCAAALSAAASERDRWDERSFTNSARILVEQANLQAAAAPRDALFQQAADQLTRALALDPFDYHHPRNRGSLERTWAMHLDAARDREPHLEAADRAYAAATALAPAAGTLWPEWANLKLERGRPGDALPLLDHAAELQVVKEVATLGDIFLATIGIDVTSPGGFTRAAGEFDARGFPHLATAYRRR